MEPSMLQTPTFQPGSTAQSALNLNDLFGCYFTVCSDDAIFFSPPHFLANCSVGLAFNRSKQRWLTG